MREKYVAHYYKIVCYVFLILGASSDIGLEILKKYLSKGYNILAHYNKGNKKLFDLKNAGLIVEFGSTPKIISSESKYQPSF